MAYWELHLAIGPGGPLSVAPYLMRGTSVDLILGQARFTLSDQQDDVEQIVSGYPRHPMIERDDGVWEVSSDGHPIYRKPRTGIDEDPPSHTVPNIGIDQVSTASVRTWLMIPGDHVPEDGEWSSGVDRLHAGDPAATGVDPYRLLRPQPRDGTTRR